ncbi:MAG: sialate O-acetylesterase [Candidatus Hydrogenedens sp.]|nr:sialate O-acetylesterase [Candidatus Hydrogenedens sp.]
MLQRIGLAVLLCVIPAAAHGITLEGLVDYQVVQVEEPGSAVVTLSGSAPDGAVEVRVDAAESSATLAAWQPLAEAANGTYSGSVTISQGGPYIVAVRSAAAPEETAQVSNVLAGDLWVLAGQSNMQGVGNLTGLSAPHAKVNLLRMNHEWCLARDPLHILAESPDAVHGTYENDEARANAIAQSFGGSKGAGLGLPFAIEMVQRTGRPVGLIATAHGGTSMAQWDPKLKDQGGDSLYGSMLAQVAAAGGKVRGVLWYQGESDANPDAVPVFAEKFAALVQAMRDDFGGPEMPFYSVQIGRFVQPAPRPDWDAIQTLQLASESIPHTGVVASVDLALDDLIHVGTPSLARLGARLANLAERDLFGGSVSAGPRISGAERAATPYGQCIRVLISGANGGLRHEGRLSGFSVCSGPDGPEALEIYKQEIDPQNPEAVLLWVQNMPEQPHVWYGRHADPYCNLTDSADMALPVTGPVRVSSR